MLTEDQQLDLEESIASWLDTAPSDEDILSYAEKMPEDDELVIYRAAEGYLRLLFERKDRYFESANCEEFVQEISIADQIVAFDNLSHYSTHSVQVSLAKTYPAVAKIILPQEIHEWSAGFLVRMERALALLTAREYGQSRIYMTSLQKLHDLASLTALRDKVQELFLEEGTAHDAGRPLGPEDVESWRTFYTSLNFFPKEKVDQLAQVESYLERYRLNTSLIDALTLLCDTEGIADLNAALWHLARWRRLRSFIVNQDATRIAKSSIGKTTAEFYRQLNAIWTEDAILNGQTVGPTRALVVAWKDKILPINLLTYFQDSLLVEASLDPLDAETVVNNINEFRSDAEAEVYITQVSSAEGYSEEQRKMLKSLLHQIAQLIRGTDIQQAPTQPVAPTPAT